MAGLHNYKWYKMKSFQDQNSTSPNKLTMPSQAESFTSEPMTSTDVNGYNSAYDGTVIICRFKTSKSK